MSRPPKYSLVTRFQWLLLATLALEIVIVRFAEPVTAFALLSMLFSLAGLGVGLGVSFPQWQMFGPSICRVSTRRKVVALTFDDGPDPASTPALLALLEARHVRAAFFCIGQRVIAQPELTKQMAAAGHLVENHTQQHNPVTNLFSTARLRADIADAQQAIQRITGRAPVLFRPPMGLTNQRVFQVMRELGLQVAGYTVRGLDKRESSPEIIAARIGRGIQPGAILLLHDGGVPAERLVKTVSLVLDQLEAGGYQCFRLDELIASSEAEP
ncbi:MAG: polysaccharide deacetylase family protein [Verrucomicrobiota bacterium]